MSGVSFLSSMHTRVSAKCAKRGRMVKLPSIYKSSLETSRWALKAIETPQDKALVKINGLDLIFTILCQPFLDAWRGITIGDPSGSPAPLTMMRSIIGSSKVKPPFSSHSSAGTVRINTVGPEPYCSSTWELQGVTWKVQWPTTRESSLHSKSPLHSMCRVH